MPDLVPINRSQPALAGRGKLSRQVARESRSIEAAKAVQGEHDRARAELAVGKISDVTRVTRHGIVGATYIGEDAETAVQLAPHRVRGIERIVAAGEIGITQQIEKLSDPWA